MEALENHWGRYNKNNTLNLILSCLVFFVSPWFVIYFWQSCEFYQCSLYETLLHPGQFFDSYPRLDDESIQIFSIWMIFQLLLYLLVPGKLFYGQMTPAGEILSYRINGLKCWLITHGIFFLLCITGMIKASIIYHHWMGLLVLCNGYGFFLTVFAYMKAHLFPSHPQDRKFSGSILYDLFMGIELNPRIGNFDFKLFHNGRPGILGWTLINFSFLWAQYEIHGYISNSMILVNFFHLIYVLDFFYNEDWYLKTIDIAHDHFGFYLAWGSMTFLPFMYTLQAQYLVKNPIDLSFGYAMFILLLGLGGYALFRAVNHQKEFFRKHHGDCMIWGRKATYIRAEYIGIDNIIHESSLLCSGFWGLARHLNYLGDLLFSLAVCLCCGFQHVLPYFYIIFMTILLVQRIERDHDRCLGKYGKHWKVYCQMVPWKLIPWVY